MRKQWLFVGFLAVVALLLSALLSPTEAKKKKFTFVGVKKCAKCHKKSKLGKQYQTWKKMKHANAYKVLGTKKAKEVAAKMGIKNPQKSKKCLKCHVTGYMEEGKLPKKVKKENGVGCESCHGPGSHYYKKSVMKKIGKNKKLAPKYGLEIPSPKTCARCHNSESPTFKGPDPKKDWEGFVKTMKKKFNKIKHLRPDFKVSDHWK